MLSETLFDISMWLSTCLYFLNVAISSVSSFSKAVRSETQPKSHLPFVSDSEPMTVFSLSLSPTMVFETLPEDDKREFVDLASRFDVVVLFHRRLLFGLGARDLERRLRARGYAWHRTSPVGAMQACVLSRRPVRACGFGFAFEFEVGNFQTASEAAVFLQAQHANAGSPISSPSKITMITSSSSSSSSFAGEGLEVLRATTNHPSMAENVAASVVCLPPGLWALTHTSGFVNVVK